MREEVLRILKLVEEGKITAAEAERLLDALEKGESKPKPKPKRRLAGEELKLNPEKPLKITLKGGQLVVVRSEEARLVGEGVTEEADGVHLTGGAQLLWPGRAELEVSVYWGALEGEVPRLSLELVMGSAKLVGVEEGKVRVCMGNAELKLSREFRGLEASCDMGNLEIYTPVGVSVQAEEHWGSVSVDPAVQDPDGPPVKVSARMGEAEVKRV